MRHWTALLLLASALCAAAEEPPTQPSYVYVPVTAFNLYLYHGMMGIPTAVAVDPAHGEIWVADGGHDLLSVFQSNGVSLFAFNAPAVLRQPQRIAVNPGGDVFVVEGTRATIRRFNYRGDYEGEVPLERFEEKPSIGAIAFDPRGNLYVAENRSGQVFVYTPNGKLRFRFGSRGTGEGQFLSICGIAIAPDGGIFVVDQQATAVQSFDEQGNFLAGWGRHEMGRENFALPSGIAVNSRGQVIVSDELRQDIKTFDRNGKVLQLFGGSGTVLGGTTFPTAIAVDAHDNLYVAERGNRRVQVFALVPATRK